MTPFYFTQNKKKVPYIPTLHNIRSDNNKCPEFTEPKLMSLTHTHTHRHILRNKNVNFKGALSVIKLHFDKYIFGLYIHPHENQMRTHHTHTRVKWKAFNMCILYVYSNNILVHTNNKNLLMTKIKHYLLSFSQKFSFSSHLCVY